MNHLLLLSLAAAVFLAAAGFARSADEPPLKDTDVLQKVYDKDFKTPKGFVQDHALANPNLSLYFHQDGWFADDKAAAKKIVQDFLDKPSGIEVKKIQEEKETPRSFDFRGGTIWFRVHKPAWFTFKGKRVGDYNATIAAPGKGPVEVGQFKADKLSKDALRDFAEYEWLIDNYNLNGAKVLLSEGKEADGQLTHTLWATNVTYGDFGLQDEIRLMQVTFTADKKTGKTTKEVKAVKTLTGKRN
jgi:hypothetical protein